MVDINLISRNYSMMADQQIIEVAKKDGIIISHEAFIVLKREFKKRNLDMILIEDVELARVDVKRNNIRNNILKEELYINQKLWDFVIQSRYENISDEEIIQGLTDKGVTIEDATNAVDKLEHYVTKISKETENKIFKGIVFIGIAGLIAYLSYTVWNNWLWVVLPIIFIIRIGGPLLNYIENNDKYNFIIKNARRK